MLYEVITVNMKTFTFSFLVGSKPEDKYEPEKIPLPNLVMPLDIVDRMQPEDLEHILTTIRKAIDKGPTELAKNSISISADNPEEIREQLQNLVEQGKIPEDAADEILTDIQRFIKSYNFV